MWRSEDILRKPIVSFYSLGTETELRLLDSVERRSAHSAIPGLTCLGKGLKIEKIQFHDFSFLPTRYSQLNEEKETHITPR